MPTAILYGKRTAILMGRPETGQSVVDQCVEPGEAPSKTQQTLAGDGPLACCPRESYSSRYGRPRKTLCPEFSNLIGVNLNPWPTKSLSLATGAFQAGFGALGNPDSLLFRERRHDRDDGIPEDPAGVEPLLCEAAILDAIAGESVEMRQGFVDSFAGKPIQRPEQEDIKLPATGGLKHRLELLTLISGASLLVDKLRDHNPILPRCKLP